MTPPRLKFCIRLWIVISVFVGPFLLIWYLWKPSSYRNIDETETPVTVNRTKRDYHNIDHHGVEDNSWWQMTKEITRKYTDQSCYVCSVWPHSAWENPLLSPYPLNMSYSLKVLGRWTKRHFGDNDWKKWPWGQELRTVKFRDPKNFTSETNWTVVNKNMVMQLRSNTNPYEQPQMCFHSPETNYTRFKLGETKGCNITLTVACGKYNCANRTDQYTHPTGGSSQPVPYVVKVKIATLVNEPRPTEHNSTDNTTLQLDTIVLEWPSDRGYTCPENMMWTCGQHSYLYLPDGWSGTCYLSILIPAVMKMDDITLPQHEGLIRQKRNKVSPGKKATMALVPFYGPVALAHHIDDLSVSLEKLTALVEEGFNALTAEAQALRMVALQNRAALDLLLAEKGGVCALIGDQCCTYIPDISKI